MIKKKKKCIEILEERTMSLGIFKNNFYLWSRRDIMHSIDEAFHFFLRVYTIYIYDKNILSIKY